MEEIILSIVNLRSGIRSVDLALAVMGRVNPQKFSTEAFHNAYDKLISLGEIIELQYIDPEMPYRIKSILFRKGTEFFGVGENNGGEPKSASQARLVREGQRDV